MASTWRFYGNTLVFRLAANINTVMFNGTWEHTYDNPSEVPSISVNVTQIFLNRNFQRIILPRGDGAWHPGNVVMLEGPFSDSQGDYLKLTEVRLAQGHGNAPGLDDDNEYEKIPGTEILAYAQKNSPMAIKVLEEAFRGREE